MRKFCAIQWRRSLSEILSARIWVRGVVQGVGFRPFVYRAALLNELTGWVVNDHTGVRILAEGSRESIRELVYALREDGPSCARVEAVDVQDIRPLSQREFQSFEIGLSDERSGGVHGTVTPDLGICRECVRELRDPKDRRYGYPLITCTDCGPRYSMVCGTPYDRAKTTMAVFEMCDECRAEYGAPDSRRFHAQSISCWNCGPQVTVTDEDGRVVADSDVYRLLRHELSNGAIVAAKGLGGFHLIVDAYHEDGIRRLRERKRRPHRPFALLCRDIDAARELASVSDEEAVALAGPERPILLLRKRDLSVLPDVAPGRLHWGVMLPSTAIHHLLLDESTRHLVATSGNESGSPMVSDNHCALEVLRGVADFFVFHDRHVQTCIDDSVLRYEEAFEGNPDAGRTVIPLRRARGFAPLPIDLGRSLPCVIGVGAELKNTVAISRERSVFVTEHIGDLGNESNLDRLSRTMDNMRSLLSAGPQVVACDAHPSFQSSALGRLVAERYGVPLLLVQHHHAHVAACLAEHQHQASAIGVAFDGSGFGSDGSLWGGEFLLVNGSHAERRGYFRNMKLLGGDSAVREPYRCALSLLWEQSPSLAARFESRPDVAPFSSAFAVLRKMFHADVGCTLTSSVGRLFDAVSSIAGICHKSTFEGQAAVALEDVIPTPHATLCPALPYSVQEIDSRLCIDIWPGVVLLAELHASGKIDVGTLSWLFHSTIVCVVVDVVSKIREASGVRHVALTGGVFANAFLLRHCRRALIESGFEVFVHRQVPSGDGGISLGQVAVAAAWSSGRNLPSGTSEIKVS